MLTGAKSDIAETLRIRVVPLDWDTVGLPGCEGPVTSALRASLKAFIWLLRPKRQLRPKGHGDHTRHTLRLHM